MAYRTFPLLHIQSTSVAQPLVGSWITAGIGAPAGSPITLTLGTVCAGSGYNDSNLFAPGDQAFLIDPNGTNYEVVSVLSIGGIANTIIIGPQQGSPGGVPNPVTLNKHVSGAYGTGTFIGLALDINNAFVQPEDGNAGTFVYIGNAYNMTATYHRVAKMPKVPSTQNPYYWNSSLTTGVNPVHTSELWILGGSGNSSDGYNVAYAVV